MGFKTIIIHIEKKDDVYAQNTYKCCYRKLLHQFAPSLCKIPVDVKEEILYKHLMKLQ
uniref:Uncharacterized protein n=1 Tax=Rhizophagus irregularis (strain DAOM 181602 / DAOM 197198 / MUCL 43194) TaxID=747089 RepID=U9US87_RHIID